VPEKLKLAPKLTWYLPRKVAIGNFHKENTPMATVTKEQVQAAYQQWTKELNLSEEQKKQFSAALDSAAAKLDEMAAKGETVDSAKAKQVVRSSVEKWLTPEQLVVWDRGINNAKSFLGL
jgi:hypothetical protein